MKIEKKETTVDFTGDEVVAMIREKIQAELGEEVKIKKLDITYRYEPKQDGKGYKRTDEIKRVRITL